MSEKMTQAAKLARSEYQRKYYQEHKEQRREYNRKYWERKATEKAKKEENNDST